MSKSEQLDEPTRVFLGGLIVFALPLTLIVGFGGLGLGFITLGFLGGLGLGILGALSGFIVGTFISFLFAKFGK